MRRIWGFIIILPLFLLCSCAPQKGQVSFTAMNTVIDITAYGNDAQKILEKEMTPRINQLDSLLTNKISGAPLDRLNSSATGKNVTLPSETVKVLSLSLEYAKKTNGIFDPTIAPIADLWGFGTSAECLPSSEEITKRLPLVNYRNVVISQNQVSFTQKGMKMDLGGIGKGYASDIVSDLLRKKGIKSALFSLGGSSSGVIGKKTDGSLWKIGIKDPDSQANEFIGILSCSDIMISTSGDYEQYFIADGIRYHHILDPKTGFSAKSSLRSATVVCPNGAMADAYSTAVFIMGEKAAFDFCKSQKGVGLILVTQDKRVIVSKALASQFVFKGKDKGYTYEIR